MECTEPSSAPTPADHRNSDSVSMTAISVGLAADCRIGLMPARRGPAVKVQQPVIRVASSSARFEAAVDETSER